MKSAVLLGLTSVLMLGACASVKPLPPTSQYKVTHAGQWASLATQIVAGLPGASVVEKPSVYVAPGPVDMPFAAAFKRQLEEQLLAADFKVVQSSAGAIVLNFDTQTYWYGPRNERRLVDYASFYTTVGGLGTLARHISSVDTGVFAAMAAGPALDALYGLNDKTNAEVNLSIRVLDATRVHYAKSFTFYIPASDIPLYGSSFPRSAPQTMAAQANGLDVVAIPVRSAR